MKTEQSLNQDFCAASFFERWFHETEARDLREWDGEGEKVIRCFRAMGNWSSLPLDPYEEPCGSCPRFSLEGHKSEHLYMWSHPPCTLPPRLCMWTHGWCHGSTGTGNKSSAVQMRWSAVVLHLCAAGYSSDRWSEKGGPAGCEEGTYA